ncbi:MAG: hypothetical protein ACC742_03965 [Thermoanaerobaculales bacterium]
MRLLSAFLGCAIGALLLGIGTPAATAEEPKVEVPQPTVPGLFTIQGQFTRIAYNNEGWVTLGYRVANDSQDQDWLMLDVGLSLRKPTKNQKLTRENFTLKMPDGSTVPLATQSEFKEAGHLRALNARANTIRDSINYFPVEANQACAIGFFSDPTSAARSISYDQVELSFRRACLGRLFFKLPEGKKIVPGQYWLYVDFAGSQVQTPFRIMTKEEEKFLKKNWKDLKKEHEAFLKQEAAKAKQQK